jgi:hypothetical protein
MQFAAVLRRQKRTAPAIAFRPVRRVIRVRRCFRRDDGDIALCYACGEPIRQSGPYRLPSVRRRQPAGTLLAGFDAGVAGAGFHWLRRFVNSEKACRELIALRLIAFGAGSYTIIRCIGSILRFRDKVIYGSRPALLPIFSALVHVNAVLAPIAKPLLLYPQCRQSPALLTINHLAISTTEAPGRARTSRSRSP